VPPAPPAERRTDRASGSRCLIGSSSDTTRIVNIRRVVPNIKSERPAETRDFFVHLLDFEVAMDIEWVVTLASPTNPSAQVMHRRERGLGCPRDLGRGGRR
jgi:hypothetical protein